MIKIKQFLVFLLLSLLVSQVNAQLKPVKFKFEVDGKPVKSQPKIILYVGDKKIEAEISGSSFVVPPEFQKQEKVNVHFISGKYDLLFESVYLSKFEGEWVIGVDKKPFDKDNAASAQLGRQIKQIQYINFNSTQGDGTRIVVISYK